MQQPFKEILTEAKKYYKLEHKIEGPKRAKTFFNALSKSQSMPLWAPLWDEDKRYYEILITFKDWDCVTIEFKACKTQFDKDGEIENFKEIFHKELTLDLWDLRSDDYQAFCLIFKEIEANLK